MNPTIWLATKASCEAVTDKANENYKIVGDSKCVDILHWDDYDEDDGETILMVMVFPNTLRLYNDPNLGVVRHGASVHMTTYEEGVEKMCSGEKGDNIMMDKNAV